MGKNMVQGIWNGISNAVGWIVDKIKGFCGGIVDKIKEFFGIHSPSKLLADEVGSMMPPGIAVGIEATTDDAIKAVDKMNNSILDEMNKAVLFETGKVNAKAKIEANNNSLTIIQVNCEVTGDVELDKENVGRYIAPVVSETIRTGGV